MKKLSLIFVSTFLFASGKWKHEEYEENNGDIRQIFTLWDKDSYKELSTKIMLGKSPSSEFADITFGASDNVVIKPTYLIHVKFDDNPFENFRVDYLRYPGFDGKPDLTQVQIIEHQVNKFLEKMKNAKKITVELDVEKYGKIHGRFYTEGLDLSLIK